jgi:hypothetical protein
MPRKGFVKSDPLIRPFKPPFTHAEASAIRKDAEHCDMPVGRFISHLVLSARGDVTKKPKRKRNRDTDKLADEVHALAMQVKKLGTNVNQLAKQANIGLVPISRAELQYVLNQQQQLLSAAAAYLEKAAQA